MNANYKITIPPITEPLGRYWDQPGAINILLTDVRAVMKKKYFNMLAEYSCSLPSGVYAGKMWKRFALGLWYMCWYEDHPTIKSRCLIKEKIIFIVE